MTGKASPDQPKEEPDLARFLQDWTALWREELQAQANDPEATAGAMELWRSAMTAWTGVMGLTPLDLTKMAGPREHPTGASRPKATAAAYDIGDAEVERVARGEVERVARGEIERLAGRVAELEARLAKLENAKPDVRRRGRG
jgi:hypothetical protein